MANWSPITPQIESNQSKGEQEMKDAFTRSAVEPHRDDVAFSKKNITSTNAYAQSDAEELLFTSWLHS